MTKEKQQAAVRCPEIVGGCGDLQQVPGECEMGLMLP